MGTWMHTDGRDRGDGRVEEQGKRTKPAFDRFATATARWMGQGLAFDRRPALGRALSGPIFHFSNAWQLIINTSTTVLTFLMVFLIQNTLNRDSAAIHVRLDELVHVTQQARDQLIGIEDLGDKELERLRRALERAAGSEVSNHPAAQ
jgi:low affinity Fe/Cu permease